MRRSLRKERVGKNLSNATNIQQIVEEIKQQCGCKCGPDALPDSYGNCCGTVGSLYHFLREIMKKVKCGDVLSLLNKVVQLVDQQRLHFRAVVDLAELLCRYSPAECGAVLENLRGSGKTGLMLVYEPLLAEICAHWDITKSVLLEAFGSVVDGEDTFLPFLAQFLDTDLNWEETLRMLNYYRDSREAHDKYERCDSSGKYKWSFLIVQRALHTALPLDIVPREYFMGRYERRPAYRVDDRLRPSPEGWVPYDLDGLRRPVIIALAPRGLVPVIVPFDYYYDLEEMQDDTQDNVERTSSETDQDGHRPSNLEQDTGRNSPRIHENEQGLPNHEDAVRDIVNTSPENEQHGNTHPNLEDLDLGTTHSTGIEASSIDQLSLQAEAVDKSLAKSLSTHPATEHSDPLVVHEVTSLNIVKDQTLVNNIVEIGAFQEPIKIEDDITEDVKPAVKKARLLDDLKYFKSSAGRPKLEDGLNRLAYDLQYFESPASLTLRETIKSCQKVCKKVFEAKDYGIPWAILAQVLKMNVTMGPGCIRPEHLMLKSSDWKRMRRKIETARLECDRAIPERDENPRLCWELISEFVQIGNVPFNVRKTTEKAMEEQAIRNDRAIGADSNNKGDPEKTQVNGNPPSDPDDDGSSDDGDPDGDDSEKEQHDDEQSTTPASSSMVHDRVSAMAYVPGVTGSPTVDPDVNAQILEAPEMLHKPLGRNPTPLERRLPATQIWSSRTAGMLWNPNNARAMEDFAPSRGLPRYPVLPPRNQVGMQKCPSSDHEEHDAVEEDDSDDLDNAAATERRRIRRDTEFSYRPGTTGSPSIDPEIDARISTPERMSPKPAGRAPTPKLTTLPRQHTSTREPVKNVIVQGANTKASRRPGRAFVPFPRDQLVNRRTTGHGTELKAPLKRKGPSKQHLHDKGQPKKFRSIRGSTDPLGRGHSTVAQ